MRKERNWQRIDKIMTTCYLLLAMMVLMAMKSTVASAVEPSGGVLNTGNKPRVIVSSDIGGSDPDDFQSMVHYLVYADVFDTEGLISSPPKGGRKQDILNTLAKYEIDYPNLSSWSDYYPTPDSLRAVTKQGAIQPQSGDTPPLNISSGAQHIIDRANAADSRPLYVLVWGSITDVAQAVHKDPSIKEKLRVYSIGSWNTREDRKARDYLYNNHTGGSDSLWWIENDSTFRGMYACAESSGTYGNSDWPMAHIDNHGALGEWFMEKKSKIKMGDTPSVLYILTGDPSDPGGESWGGSFAARSSVGPTFWDDRTESGYACGGRSGAYTVHKWRQQCFDDWEMRMDRAKDSAPAGESAPPQARDKGQ